MPPPASPLTHDGRLVKALDKLSKGWVSPQDEARLTAEILATKAAKGFPTSAPTAPETATPPATPRRWAATVPKGPESRSPPDII